MAWGSNAFASSMKRGLLALAVADGLGDGVADRVGELLAKVAERARDGAVHLRDEVLRESRLEVDGEPALDLGHHAAEHLARELRDRLGVSRLVDEIGEHRHSARLAPDCARGMAAQQCIGFLQHILLAIQTLSPVSLRYA